MCVWAISRSLAARLALAVIVGPLVAVVSGCGGSSESSDASGQAASPSPTWVYVLPAYEAGGACELLDYDTISSAIGIQFAVAAAAQEGETYTCIVQQAGVSYPDLTLSVANTTADAKAFQTVVMPDGATAVESLGQSAFSSAIAAADGIGPGVQVAWLSTNKRLVTLRIRLAPEATAEVATELTTKLVALSKIIDLMAG